MKGPVHTSKPPRRGAVRGPESQETATRALSTLRPLFEASSVADLKKVVQEFTDELGARRHAFSVIERAQGGPSLRWLCEDVPRWWSGFRSELLPLVTRSGSRPGHIRTLRCALDDTPPSSPFHRELRRLGAHSALFLVAEAQHPGATAACFSLLFGAGSGYAPPLGPGQLTSLCHHAASLLLDAYLRLPPPTPKSARLSARELECLRWAAVGKTSWETALILGVSERTVNFHFSNVFGKLKVNNKQAAIAQAIFRGLL